MSRSSSDRRLGHRNQRRVRGGEGVHPVVVDDQPRSPCGSAATAVISTPMPLISYACAVVLAGRQSPKNSRYAALNALGPAR